MRDYEHAFSHYKRASELLSGPRLAIHGDYGRFLCTRTAHAPVGLLHLGAALHYAEARHDAQAVNDLRTLIDMYRHVPAAPESCTLLLHAPSASCKHGKVEPLSKAPARGLHMEYAVEHTTGTTEPEPGRERESIFASIAEVD